MADHYHIRHAMVRCAVLQTEIERQHKEFGDIRRKAEQSWNASEDNRELLTLEDLDYALGNIMESLQSFVTTLGEHGAFLDSIREDEHDD